MRSTIIEIILLFLILIKYFNTKLVNFTNTSKFSLNLQKIYTLLINNSILFN